MVTVFAALSGVCVRCLVLLHRGRPYCVFLGASGVLQILLDVFGVWGPSDSPRLLLWSTKDNDVGAY
jgi:hypothetical protein